MKTIIAVCSLATLIAACGAKQETAAKSTTSTAPQSAAAAPVQNAPGTPPLAQPATAPQPAAVPAAAPPRSDRQIAGTVSETIDAAGYTYLHVKTPKGEKWAAVPQASVKKGSAVTIDAQMVADNFESKTLNRKFDQLIFGTLVDGAAAPPKSANPAQAQEHMKAPEAGEVKVAKADGGKTVAEIWAAKENGKEVVVRGKVVKFLGGIMGKNWLHLRDGSGSKANGDDDITVTTNDVAAAGDVVTVRGKVAVDKDFGAGYRYPVIIEEAKLQK